MTAKLAHGPLRLLPSPQPPAPLPELAHVYEDRLRRPGELHERFPLTGETPAVLERAASAGGLPTGTAARLLVEAALVRADLVGLGRTGADALLDAAAQSPTVRRRLSSAETDYVRGLRRPPGTARTMVTLPLRLIGRAGEIDVASALAGDLARAVAWEVAAVLSGHTMLEWALTAVLRSG